MKSKLKLISVWTLLVAAIGLGVFAADNPGKPDTTNTVAASSGKTLYTCGMHPWIIQDHPGNCPICGMKLEPVHKIEGTAEASSSAIAIDPATIQLMNLQTTEIARGPLRRSIRTVGTIDYNETALADVTTKFKGWIEKLDADATGQLVHRGEPLFEIYSPELYSAEAEYLAVLNSTNDSGASPLREASLGKLKFFDVSDAQIAELEKSPTPNFIASASTKCPTSSPTTTVSHDDTSRHFQPATEGLPLPPLSPQRVAPPALRRLHRRPESRHLRQVQ